jgi:hypothetical protein
MILMGRAKGVGAWGVIDRSPADGPKIEALGYSDADDSLYPQITNDDGARIIRRNLADGMQTDIAAGLTAPRPDPLRGRGRGAGLDADLVPLRRQDPLGVADRGRLSGTGRGGLRRDPLEQGRIMQRAMAAAGLPGGLILLGGDDHYLSKSASRARFLGETETFLAKYLPVSP